MTSKNKRFQYQPWYVKLWRLRYYFLIPFVAIRVWVKDRLVWNLTFKQSWDLAIGLVQIPMKWVYDYDELKAIEQERDLTSYKVTITKSANLVWARVDSNSEWVGCGYNKEQALRSLRETIEFHRGIFNIKDWWLSKRIKFSRTGKL